MDSSLLKLDGSIKIKVSYDDKKVYIQSKVTNWSMVDYGNAMIWTSTDNEFCEKIDAFERQLLENIIENKKIFFEKQRKIFASDDDIRNIWTFSTKHDRSFKTFSESKDESSISKLGIRTNSIDDSPAHFSFKNVSFNAHCSHVWISKSKAGVIWIVDSN